MQMVIKMLNTSFAILEELIKQEYAILPKMSSGHRLLIDSRNFPTLEKWWYGELYTNLYADIPQLRGPTKKPDKYGIWTWPVAGVVIQCFPSGTILVYGTEYTSNELISSIVSVITMQRPWTKKMQRKKPNKTQLTD